MGASDVRPSLSLELPAQPESAPRARYAVREALGGLTLDAAAVDLAVSEAVTNVIVHAYRDRDAGEQPGRVRVDVVIAADCVWIAVSDDGVGMAPRPDSPGLGMGLRLMATLCDELEIEQRPDGTDVRMRFGHAAAPGE